MSRQQRKLIIDALRQENVAYIQQKEAQEYLNGERDFLYYLAWMAAENNYLESERTLKKQILEQFHKRLSRISFIIANGDPLSDLSPYSRKELIEALAIARFTKQPLEIRNELKNKLINNFNYSKEELQFNKAAAKAVNDEYLGHFSPNSLRWNATIVLGGVLVIGSIPSGIIATLMGLGPLVMAVMLPMILVGAVILGVSLIQLNKPSFRCADNLVIFASEESTPDIINTTSDLSDTFKIPATAKVNIDKLERMSPGIVADLKTHFLKRIEIAEEYAAILDKDREAGIVDNSEIKKLLNDWRNIMNSAAEGTDSFCQQINRYLRTFEEGQQGIEDLCEYTEAQKKSLIFANIDKKIDAHITEIASKANLKL